MKFHAAVEWNRLQKKNDPRMLSNYIESQVVPELFRFADWAKVFNLKPLLDLYNLHALELSAGTVQPSTRRT